MKLSKRFLSILTSAALAVSMVLSPLQAMAAEAPLTGTTGEVAWSLDAGTLTLSGSGATADYASGTKAEKAAPWFNQMDEITKVVVEEGVTALGDRLFYGADNLAAVVFPETSLKSIGEGAFRGCPALEEIVLPDSLQTLERVSFFKCTVIGGTMTELADQIFTGCTSLSHVEIPASVSKILATEKDGQAITTFNGCTALSTVTFGGTVQEWKLLLAQGNSDELKNPAITVTCADGVYAYDPNVALPNPGEEEPGEDDGAEETTVTGTTGDVTWTLNQTTGILTLSGSGATADYAGKGTAANAAPWLVYAEDITKVVIEEGVTALGDRLFYGANKLSEVVFPESSLKSIGVGTFRLCASLKEITLPDSLETLERVSFYECKNLEKVVLGGENSKLTTLKDQTFNRCNKLTEITIPSSVTTFLFSGNNGPMSSAPLETIYYTGTVAQWKALLEGTDSREVKKGTITVYCSDDTYIDGSLGNGIVYTLDGGMLTLEARLESGEMPDFVSPADLPWAADAESVTKVVIQNDITKIGANAFADCVNIREVVYVGGAQGWAAIQANSGENNDPLFAIAPSFLSSGVCGEDVAFTYAPETHCLTISGTGATYDYTSGSLTPWGVVRGEIEKLVVEEGVTYLGGYLFNKAYNLTSVTLPDTLVEIGTFTFGQCSSLTSLDLPEGLEVIGSKAFSGAGNLKEIDLPGTLKYIDMKAFENASGLKDVYYNGTQGGWDQIIISESAGGNSTLLSAQRHLQGEVQTYTDVPEGGDMANAGTDVTDNGSRSVPSEDYGVEESADMDMVLEALYVRADAARLYGSAEDWAAENGLARTSLTIAALADTLYAAAIVNGAAEEGAASIDWCAPYLANIANLEDTSRVLTRGEASLVLAAYLQSPASNANRQTEQKNILLSALAQGGDGKLYIYVPDLTTDKAGTKPGDCTLVVFPDGKTMLIDSAINTSEKIVVGMLEDLGITYLDYFMLSHPHSDHIGNAVAVVEYLQENGGGIGTMYDSGYDYKGYTQKVYDALKETTVVEHLADGDTFSIGEVSAQVFNPTAELIEELNKVESPGDEIVNNISLTVKFTYGDSTYLTGGDLYTSRELQLIEKHGDALQADILKSDHHGAYTSNCEEWMDVVAPMITFVESDDIGSTPLAKMCAEKGIAFCTFGLDGSILISMGQEQDYEVITQKSANLKLETAEEDEQPSSGGSSKPSVRDDAEVKEPETAEPIYTDVPETHWAYEAIEAVSKAGLFNGTSATTFSPELDITRGQLMTVLARLSGAEAKTIEQGVVWTAANGISDGTNPEAKITREQLVTMLYRAAGEPAVTGDLSAYTDAASVSEYAHSAMTWAVAKGIVTGMTETTLVPGSNATRAQIAAIMQRCMEL